MGISNEWQNIDEIAYTTITDISVTRGATGWNSDSAQSVASAIGWETTSFPADVTEIAFSGATYDATDFNLIRPDSDYNVGVFIGNLIGSSGYNNNGLYFFEIDTGSYIYYYSFDLDSSFLLLRPTAQGCFCLKSSSYYVMFDKFYNPKADVTKWGAFHSSRFLDIYTGLIFDYTLGNTYYVSNFNFGGYVALKKFTAIASAGVYNAKTIYKSYIDYSNATKTVELGGSMYCGIQANYTPFYIRLAD